MDVMKTTWAVGALSLLGLLLATTPAKADPILSDRLVITDPTGKVILDVKRFESTPSLPELGISSGSLVVPHNALNVAAGVILTDPGHPDFNSDWIKVSVHSGKKNDKITIVFKSNPDEKSLNIPKDFPKGAQRIAETGQLQDLTAYLFPKYAAAGIQAPFKVEAMSDDDRPGKVGVGDVPQVPEPASLALLATGALALGGCAWRKRRKAARAAQRITMT
jgi:hypothetical protein